MAVRCLFFVFSLSGLLLLIAVVTRTVQSCDSEAGLATYNLQRRQGVMDRVGARRLVERRLNYRGSLLPASQKQMLRVRGRRQAAQLLPLTSQAPPTYPWAIDWGPTLLPEETSDFLSTQEAGQSQQQRHHQRPEQATPTQRPVDSERGEEQGRETGREGDMATLETDLYETEPEAVDPQFYVTVTISTLLILIAAAITAKLCYDHSRSPPPLSHRSVAAPGSLSLSLSRSLISEESRQALTYTAGLPRLSPLPLEPPSLACPSRTPHPSHSIPSPTAQQEQAHSAEFRCPAATCLFVQLSFCDRLVRVGVFQSGLGGSGNCFQFHCNMESGREWNLNPHSFISSLFSMTFGSHKLSQNSPHCQNSIYF
ncbi:PILR alpha-associated neural protein isoform X1 [Acipenser oxyrinchus oxyrinchus]|uniref:PILR alpha-associated neural protein isoform X1 n=1 Tax=Acipenser oxyrinchus oxyrinchus TaxID=40147 RepID=A0AAD8D6N9_ACIOX|nr:PILR alpha-associated neural protein isoform X1 [Acipenser oxyrinchus oxyrinchus]